MNLYDSGAEKRGRKRFPDNRSFRLNLYNRASIVQASLLDLLPSNYPLDSNTNLAEHYYVIAREFARQRWGINAIREDVQYTNTRIEYLQQILGERLFLDERIAPANYNDELFREYLISIKDAYLKGSTTANIENLASKWTKQTINIRELYLEARKTDSAYDVHDTHKMIVELFVDDLISSGRDLAQLSRDLDFFVSIVRPAHVYYDTRFIWTEQIDVNKVYDLIFGDTGGGCIPLYDYLPLGEKTILALQVRIVDDPGEATGRIDSVQHDFFVFFLENDTKIIVEPGTDGTPVYNSSGRRIQFNELKIGDYVKINYLVIPGQFQFWRRPSELLTTPYDQYYRHIYRRPLFQEYVKKIMDSKGRFPLQEKTTPTTICDRHVQDLLNPLYEDIRSDCRVSSQTDGTYSITLAEKMWVPRLSVPYSQDDVHDQSILGDLYEFTMSDTPLTDGSGGQATPSDIGFAYDGTVVNRAVISVDASSGLINLTDSTSFWDASAGDMPVLGNQMAFNYTYLDNTDVSTDSTHIFGISPWQMPVSPLISSDGSNLAEISDISITVDGTSISNAVTEIRPILGHVFLNTQQSFWSASELGRTPGIGDQIDFYYTQSIDMQYSMLFDDIQRPLDSFGGENWPYTFLFDGTYADSSGVLPISKDGHAQIGYRYRSYLLHHSSVLNSPDTLLFNNYQKPALRASLINQQDSVSHFNIFFSPEFLDDTGQNIVLNDNYLENDLDPALKLNPDTPPFQKTFSHHPRLIYHQKLQDIRDHRNPLLYSDMLLKEFVQEGEDTNLSSICESDELRFKIRIGDEIPSPQECKDWIYFDIAQTDTTTVTIQGTYASVPMLRITDKKLRHNFILREIEDTGIISVSYTTNTPKESGQTIFNLPETVQMDVNEVGIVDFPALPVMKDSINLADISDISVTVGGDPVIVLSLDAVDGIVTIDAPPTEFITDTITLDDHDIIVGEVALSGYLVDPSVVTFKVNGSLSTDFYILDQKLIWRGGPLESSLVVGDILEIYYETDPLINSEVVITYNIKNTRNIEVIDEYRSKIMDNDYVFGSLCPSPIKSASDMQFNEYFNFLDDYSEGIKLVYFNKTNYQIEEHVFSGPVFELYNPSEDELSSPEAFPNALVRLPEPPHSDNPLQVSQNYAFINDPLVRFKKKIFKELLPDRTFRTIKITEMDVL